MLKFLPHGIPAVRICMDLCFATHFAPMNIQADVSCVASFESCPITANTLPYLGWDCYDILPAALFWGSVPKTTVFYCHRFCLRERHFLGSTFRWHFLSPRSVSQGEVSS